MLLVVFAGSSALGQALPLKTPSTSQERNQQQELKNQNDMLRAQLEVMKQYDQRLLNTVYWALGTLAAVAAALVGFGWFANFRVYERDKNALAQEPRRS